MDCPRLLIGAAASLALLACAPHYDSSLPDSASLGGVGGYQVARVITHFHSPYSWDACDSNPFPGGTLDATCLADVRAAFCANRIDFAFLSDHPDKMTSYDFNSLLLEDPAD